MIIAICGLHLEASTFSAHVSRATDFQVLRGNELLARYDFLAEDWASDLDWLPILHARALPGGPLDPKAYTAWSQEILAELRAAGPIDGVLFDIHGAMSVPGVDDPEGTLAHRIRDVIGPRPMISAAMDLHGNVSPALFAACDLLTCYRTAPHVDTAQTRRRAAKNLVESCRRGVRPAKALVPIPILLPGEQTSTHVEPAASLYARIPEIEAQPHIIDAAFWVGYPWADEPRNHAAVVVTGDDQTAVTAAALEFATCVWERRHDFSFVGPTGTFAECWTVATDEASPCPFFISDSGDNPGAGGAGDNTLALHHILNYPVTNRRAVVASIVDPDYVLTAIAAGHKPFTHSLGGCIDRSTPPVSHPATVAALIDDPDGGPTVAVQMGPTTVVVTSRRSQYGSADQFVRLGIDLGQAEIVVVKMGYLEPDLEAVQRGWLLALTPGGVDQDLIRLGHGRIMRPMIPFDADIPAPSTVLT